jgi:DNA repair protein RadC
MAERPPPGVAEAPVLAWDVPATAAPAAVTRKAAAAPRPHHMGHRERLRQRMKEGGPMAFQTYELLEYVLGLALPRIDTKPLAKALLAEFGQDLGRLLAASPERLAQVKGMGEAGGMALAFIQALLVRSQRDLGHYRHRADGVTPVTRRLLSSWDAVMDYLDAAMADRSREQFRVIFLDARNQLLHDEVMGEGSTSTAPVYEREIVRRALELGASALLLVHNHPSGDPAASRDDIAMTRKVIEAGKTMGITVHDHIIIARTGRTSMRSQGLI